MVAKQTAFGAQPELHRGDVFDVAKYQDRESAGRKCVPEAYPRNSRHIRHIYCILLEKKGHKERGCYASNSTIR
jgi:hypothetical protein